MTTEELIALAARCEQVDGPDRELDVLIAVAVDWREPYWEEGEPTAKDVATRNGVEYLVGRVHATMSIWRYLPKFTASIDAALTLVPEGYKIQLDTLDEAGSWARVHAQSASNSWDGAAATPALALCAAALRARGEG